MNAIENFFHSFAVFNINAIYSILFFLKYNFAFFFVLVAIGYVVYEELKYESANLIDDQRRII